MRCLFINLDDATARRERLEASFRALAPAGWTLERVAAAGPDDARALEGRAAPRVKACYTSHLRALDAALAGPGDVLILEDDVLLAPETFGVIDHLQGEARDWDLLFTELSLADPRQLFWAAHQRERLARTGSYQVADLSGVRFVGATAYVVRDRAKAKMRAALQAGVVDEPYDIVLREVVHAGGLRASYVLPFITSITEANETSQIATEPLSPHLQALNAYRRMLFVGRDLEACERDVRRLAALAVDRPARVYGQIWQVLLETMLPHP